MGTMTFRPAARFLGFLYLLGVFLLSLNLPAWLESLGRTQEGKSPAPVPPAANQVSSASARTSSPAAEAPIREGGTAPFDLVLSSYSVDWNSRSGGMICVRIGKVTPAAVVAGDTITLSWSVLNRGAAFRGPVRVRVFVSSHSVPRVGETVVEDFTSDLVLSAGDRIRMDRPVTVPASLAAGIYDLEIAVEALGTTAEARTANNSLKMSEPLVVRRLTSRQPSIDPADAPRRGQNPGGCIRCQPVASW